MAFINVQEETDGPLILVQLFQDALGGDSPAGVWRPQKSSRQNGMLAENQERLS